jgi:glucose-6-phosphate 1-epimerase
VGDITGVKLYGLEGKTYLDKVDNGISKTQSGVVTIDKEVDRIYTAVAGELVIEDPSLQRRIKITSKGSTTTVVWNPWAGVAAEMGDLEDADYLRLLCVETANAADEVVDVPPAGEYRLQTVYRIESDPIET